MKKIDPYKQKAWGGVTGRVLGKCIFCKKFSFADVMLQDENGRPFHEACKTLKDREDIDDTHTMTDSTN